VHERRRGHPLQARYPPLFGHPAAGGHIAPHPARRLAGAPVGVVIITPDPKQRWSILFDAGQAAAYMQLAAWEQGVGSCLATIYDTDEARNLLHFPSDWEAHVALSFGFPAEPEEMSRPLRPGGRKPPDELFHFEEWGRRT